MSRSSRPLKLYDNFTRVNLVKFIAFQNILRENKIDEFYAPYRSNGDNAFREEFFADSYQG